MSFSLLRVPKKAALTALRGLVVGTSCTLLLITEDRRRRINQARSAVRNADRIRSSKQYHAARPDLVEQSSAQLQDFEDVITSSATAPRRRRPRGGYEEAPDSQSLVRDGRSRSEQAAQAENPEDGLTSALVASVGPRDGQGGQQSTQDPVRSGTDQPERAADTRAADTVRWNQLRPLPHGLRALPSLRDPQLSPALFKQHIPISLGPTLMARQFVPPEIQNIDVMEFARRIREAVALGDVPSLDGAVGALRDAVRKSEFVAEEKTALVQAAASLCSKCQEVGAMDSAAWVLHHLVSLDSLLEADYHAANPQPVVAYVLSAFKAALDKVNATCERPNRDQRLSLRSKLDRAMRLLLPNFTEGTLSPPKVEEWVPVIAKSMDLAFDLHMIVQASDAYWRIQHYNGDDTGQITLRFMERLAEQTRPKRIINTFNLIRHRLARYEPDIWYAIGDLATDAAEISPGQDPAKLLKNMAEFCPAEVCAPGRPLRTTWVTKLLYNHWKRVGSFEQTRALFQEFDELGGLEKVVFVDGPFRVMIQIAVEAEHWQAVDELVRKLLVVKPSTSAEARIIGLLALAKAKVGDWNGVWDDFQRMKIKYRMHDVFAPILHEYIKTHTTRETEEFLKQYVEGLRMHIGSYMVNMIANRYGDIRDIQSFVNWLEYCSSKGFEIDAAFGNAVLTNCRRRFGFGHSSLQSIYRTLRALSPKSVDDVSENDMTSGVLREHRQARPKFVRRQIALLGHKTHRLGGSGELDKIRLDLRQAFVTRDYRRTVLLYKSAWKRGARVDEGHLRYAVKASLKGDSRLHTAVRMIKEAKAKGMDVSTSITPVFLTQMHHLFKGDTSDKERLLRQVQTLIAQFQESGLSLGHQALLRTAHHLFLAKHYQGALSMALSALQRKGISYPDDVPTFQLLIHAYAHKSDVEGMKWTIAGAVHTQYFHKKRVYVALKESRQLLLKQIQTSDVKKAMWVVEEGLDRHLIQRGQLDEDRRQLERGTIDIMKRAALEADPAYADRDAIRRRDDALRELEQKARREHQEASAAEVKKRKEMEARRRAADELTWKTERDSEAWAMETLLMEGRHEVPGDF